MSIYNYSVNNVTTQDVTSVNIIDNTGSRELYIYSSFLTNNSDTKTGLNNSFCLDNIPISCNNNQLLTYQNQTPMRNNVIDKYVNTINIRLYDDEYNLINITQNYTLTLMFEEFEILEN